MCLTFVALILLLNGDGAREQKLLIFIMCGSLVQNVGYLLELTAPTVFFNWYGIFYRNFEWLSTANGFHYVSITYGPLYFLSLVTRIIVPYILSIHTLARAIRLRSDQQVSRQYKTILAITTLPVILLVA